MTGVVYDEKFTEHECLWDRNYSECPRRYTSVLERCNSLGLIDRCVRIETRPATREELLSKHTAEHVELLESTQEYYDEEKLEHLSSKYDSIYVHPSTYKQSLLAAGSAIELAKAVSEGRVQNGMAFVRPPGHHAMKSEYCGYCFFNNVALAAQYLLDKTTTRKILIVDWDIHHGQATQQMFYDDPRVLYFSIHRYEHGLFWPNLKESDFYYVGSGDGKGFNVNVPLNSTGMKNKDYMALVHYLLIPLAIEFSPDLILISSGYDSAIGDPKGEMLITPAFYAHTTQKLMSLVEGKVIAILEGGYFLPALAESAALTLRALLGDPCPLIESLGQPSECLMMTIKNVISTHAMYWKCFEYSVLCDEDYSPLVSYNFFDKKPDIYQTRNMYPEIDTTNVDAILNNIIKGTKLLSPQFKLGLEIEMIDQSNKSNDFHRFLKSQIGNLHILKKRLAKVEELNIVYTTEYIERVLEQQKCIYDVQNIDLNIDEIKNECCYTVGSLLQIVDSIFENKIKSGIYANLSSATNFNKNKDPCVIFNAAVVCAKYAVKKYSLKRVLIIEFNEEDSLEYASAETMVMFIRATSLTSKETMNVSNIVNDDCVDIPIFCKSKSITEDVKLTLMMLFVNLPMAYEYNPELIIVSSSFCSRADETNRFRLTPIIYGYLIQWLSTLANGRIIVCEQQNKQNYSDYREECLLECSKALLGKPIAKLCLENLYNLNTQIHLQEVISTTPNGWEVFQCFKTPFLVDLKQWSITFPDSASSSSSDDAAIDI